MKLNKEQIKSISGYTLDISKIVGASTIIAFLFDSSSSISFSLAIVGLIIALWFFIFGIAFLED